MAEEVKAFLDEYLAAFEALETDASLRLWEAAKSGEEADFDAYAEALLAVRTMHSDRDQYQKIIGFLENRDALHPMTARVLEVALLDFKGNQLTADLLREMVDTSTEIEQIFNTFRAEVFGEKRSNNDMLEVEKTDGRRVCPKCSEEKPYMIHESVDKTVILNDYPKIYGKKFKCGTCGIEWRER